MQLQLVFASIVKWLGCPPCIYGAHCKLAEPELRGFFFDIVHSTHSLIIGIYANQKVRTNALFSLGMPFCNVRKFTRITQRKKGVISLHERLSLTKKIFLTSQEKLKKHLGILFFLNSVFISKQILQNLITNITFTMPTLAIL